MKRNGSGGPEIPRREERSRGPSIQGEIPYLPTCLSESLEGPPMNCSSGSSVKTFHKTGKESRWVILLIHVQRRRKSRGVG